LLEEDARRHFVSFPLFKKEDTMSVAQSEMLAPTIPLSVIAEAMRERLALALAITSDAAQVAYLAFAQADADVDARLENWAAHLATVPRNDA
jgi:hypothetical protein